ncbi:hypothetical protein FBUS_02526 [Fasciolopsis buskii]|uniref:Tetraspanin n=1 Tax=Fasciolopsis buskii TaxID=27845 RepID=A0A8E0RVR3_9TREM|nr:hypothetical protein FBUS_02526 [Fasciolopsis buski]
MDGYLCDAWLQSDKANTVSRCVLLALNVVSWILGCLCIGLSIYEFYYSDYHLIRSCDVVRPFTGSFILGVAGTLLVLVHSVGSTRVMKRSKATLCMFSTAALTIGVIFLSAGLWVSNYGDKVVPEIAEMLGELVDKYDETRLLVTDETKLLNMIHFKLNCCGITGVSDFKRQWPLVSCSPNPEQRSGCLKVLKSALQLGLFRVGLCGFTGSVLQGFVAVFAILQTCWNRD